jgi:hypothetical protein
MLSSIGVVTAITLSFVSVESRTHALVQLFFFPLILFLVSRINIAGILAPRWALGFALAGALSGAVFTYTHVDLARGAFVVASLKEDRSESDGKIRRDRIRRPLGAAGLALVGTHPTVISSWGEAEDILRSNRTLGGVVWGSARWINVSLRVHEPLVMSSLSKDSFAARYLRKHGYSDLKIAAGISGIGISNSLDPTTLMFLGSIIPLWRDFPIQLTERRDDREAFEQRVRSVAGLKAHWTSFSHRALPMWITGTYHLVNAISSKIVEQGELSCAVSSLEAALSQLRPSDNPELQMAVRNNLAIALLVQAEVDVSSSDSTKAALELLKGIRRLHKVSQQGAAVSSIASFNLSTVKGKHGKRKQRAKEN